MDWTCLKKGLFIKYYIKSIIEIIIHATDLFVCVVYFCCVIVAIILMSVL